VRGRLKHEEKKEKDGKNKAAAPAWKVTGPPAKALCS